MCIGELNYTSTWRQEPSNPPRLLCDWVVHYYVEFFLLCLQTWKVTSTERHPLKRTYQIKKEIHVQSSTRTQLWRHDKAALRASDQQMSVKSPGRASTRFSASQFGLHQVSVLQSFLLFLFFHWEKVQLCHTLQTGRLTPVNSTSSLSISWLSRCNSSWVMIIII